MNQLVMNYLTIEGYKDAAEKFSQESGVKPSLELSAIDSRMRIRSAIQAGDVDLAIDRINDADPDLLDSHPRIYFKLQQHRLLELLNQDKTEEALNFAQETLAPTAEAHPDFFRELERTMSLFVWGLEEGRIGESKLKLANEVNQALLAAQSQENESKLPLLLKKLFISQERLTDKLIFPKVVDYSNCSFEPPLPLYNDP